MESNPYQSPRAVSGGKKQWRIILLVAGLLLLALVALCVWLDIYVTRTIDDYYFPKKFGP